MAPNFLSWASLVVQKYFELSLVSDKAELSFFDRLTSALNFWFLQRSFIKIRRKLIIKTSIWHSHYSEQLTQESQSDMAEDSEEEEIDVTDNNMENNSISQATILRSCISSETQSNSSMSNSFGGNFEQLNLTTESGCSSPQRLITPPEGSSRTSSADSRTLHPCALRQVEEHGQYDASQAANRKFECDYCPKRFVRKEEKLRHERSHTNERKYQCRCK